MLVLLSAVLALSLPFSRACDCGGLSYCETISAYGSLFHVTVLEETTNDGYKTYLAHVNETYKHTGCIYKGSDITIRTGDSGSMCGASLNTGTEYALALDPQDDGMFDLSTCSLPAQWTGLNDENRQAFTSGGQCPTEN